MIIYDLLSYNEDKDFHASWCLFDNLSEALEERDRLNLDDEDDFVVVKRIMGQPDLYEFKPYLDWEDVNPDRRSAE
jgi:hypothetical protein